MASIKDRFLYGASGSRQPEADRAPDERPRNDVVKPFFRNFGTMVQYNLISLLFMVPAVLWTGVNVVLANYASMDMNGLADWTTTVYPVLSSWLLVMIPLWAIADIGACGATAIFRRVAEGRHIFHWPVFSQAIRRYALPVAAFGAARGVVLWLLLAAMSFYTAMAQTMPFMRVFLVLGAVVLLAILAVEALLIPTVVGATGEKKWRRALSAAVTAAIWHMPVCLSAIILTVVLPAALLLIPTGGLLAWGIYQLVIGLSVRQYAFTAIAAMLGLGSVDAVDEDDYF